jgi:hypothetical protein
MINRGSEGKKLETELKHYQDEMIKISEERAHYQKELNYIRHQMIEAIEQKYHYQKRIKVLEEENIILQNENQKLQLEKKN